MKYIKTYENLNKPQVGDYVYCYEGPYSSSYNLSDDLFFEFLSKSIGKCVSIAGGGSVSYTIL